MRRSGAVVVSDESRYELGFRVLEVPWSNGIIELEWKFKSYLHKDIIFGKFQHF